MKKIKYIIILLSLTILGTPSCQLDETLRDTPTPDKIKTERDLEVVVKGIYARFNDRTMFKFLGHIMLTVCADDIYSTAGGEYGPYADRVFTSNNTTPFWDNLYAAAANANTLIETLKTLDFPTAVKNRAYGEACFVRAFSYYYLVRLYGGVPLRTEATNINSDFYLKRNTVDEVYAQIFKDFKAASDNLPEQKNIPSADLGRASKGAAQAMMAQAYLTYGNQLALKGQDATTQYTNANLYADSVINSNDYSLINNYGDLFDITKEVGAYQEVIFGIRFQVDPSESGQSAAGSEFAARFGAGNTHGVSGNTPNGQGTNTYRVAHWFADYYRKGDYSNGINNFTPNIDYRNEKAFFQRGYNSVQNKYYAVYPNIPGSTNPGSADDGTINDPLLAKYIDPNGKDGRNNGNDFFIIRLAEVYLIKAEALNELVGPTTEALTAFNKVRLRARNAGGTLRTIPANLTPVTAGNANNFRMKIFDERGLELVGEGQRWFDLVRMRSPLSPTQTMYEYQFKVVLSNENNFPRTLPTGYNKNAQRYNPVGSKANAIYAPILNVTIPKFLLFPVPETERNQNPNFGLQNPGW